MVSMERLDREDILHLFRTGLLLPLGYEAHQMRMRMHPDPCVTYVVDRNVNYTNICTSVCEFCAFRRGVGDPDAQVMTREELLRKVAELDRAEGTQLLLQGGLHPDLGLDYAKGLIESVRERYIHITIHAFSPPEILHFAQREGISVEETLQSLMDSGLDSLPGGGAEILVDSVRKRLNCTKCSSQQWLEVMETAHNLGLKTTATMMFGHVETWEDRTEHLLRIRELQDRTKGFTAFIPWTYQPGNTQLGGIPAGGIDYLRTLAISRLALDNVKNIQASWLTQGLRIGEVALHFGANDLGGTLMEENVVRSTGMNASGSESGLRTAIRNAGYRPVKRDTQYRPV